jgi:hypothetical protein
MMMSVRSFLQSVEEEVEEEVEVRVSSGGRRW